MENEVLRDRLRMVEDNTARQAVKITEILIQTTRLDTLAQVHQQDMVEIKSSIATLAKTMDGFTRFASRWAGIAVTVVALAAILGPLIAFLVRIAVAGLPPSGGSHPG